jgi:Flp pilus assembly pilin Flp
MTLIRRFGTDARGVAAVEFTFVLPLILLLLAGSFEVGRAVQVNRAVHMLSAQIALVAADCVSPTAGACAAEPATIAAAASHLTPVLDSARLNVTSAQFTRNGGLINALHLNGLTIADFSATALTRFRDGQTGIVVRVSYRHAPLIFPSLADSFMGSALSFEVTAVGLLT